MTDAAFPALTLYRLGKLVTASLDLDSTLKAIVDAGDVETPPPEIAT